MNPDPKMFRRSRDAKWWPWALVGGLALFSLTILPLYPAEEGGASAEPSIEEDGPRILRRPIMLPKSGAVSAQSSEPRSPSGETDPDSKTGGVSAVQAVDQRALGKEYRRVIEEFVESNPEWKRLYDEMLEAQNKKHREGMRGMNRDIKLWMWSTPSGTESIVKLQKFCMLHEIKDMLEDESYAPMMKEWLRTRARPTEVEEDVRGFSFPEKLGGMPSLESDFLKQLLNSEDPDPLIATYIAENQLNEVNDAMPSGTEAFVKHLIHLGLKASVIDMHFQFLVPEAYEIRQRSIQMSVNQFNAAKAKNR